MQISIITVTRNCEETLKETLDSLYSQTLFQTGEVEHIVIDGNSTDKTLEILKNYEKNISVLVSEKDEGIYDAMNKGIMMTQSNIVGILNSDDVYESPLVLENVFHWLNSNNVDLIYADLIYFKSNNPKKIKRRYHSSRFTERNLSYGLIPAHPTVFVKRWVYEKLGVFNPKFKIAGDFDWLARVLKSDIVVSLYVPQILLRMRMGGISTRGFQSLIIKNKEILQACKNNNISTNYLKICLRIIFKSKEFLFY